MKKGMMALFATVVAVGMLCATIGGATRVAANPSVPPPDQLYGTYNENGIETAYLILYVMYNDLTIKQYGDFKNDNMRSVLVEKIQTALQMIEQGNYQGAHSKIVNDILDKVDGKWMLNDWDAWSWTYDPDEKDYRVWLVSAGDALDNPDSDYQTNCWPMFCVVCPITCFGLRVIMTSSPPS
jgi:hypothetical protein